MISVETVSPWWKTFTSRTGPLATQHHFVVLQQVADAFIQSGSLDPTIRRQYAQALLDQGILKAAIAVLELLGTGFLVDGPRLDPRFPAVVHLTNAHVAGLDDPKVLSPDKAVITFRALSAQTAIYRIARLLWSSKPHELDTTILELDDHPPDAARCPIATRRLLLHTEPSPQTYSSATPAVGTSDALDVRQPVARRSESPAGCCLSRVPAEPRHDQHEQ